MELVYLWIEDYKNIKRQGFTFSPRFKCEFKPKYNENDELIPEESELIIEEKKDYVNIFPDNINVTAIVGKNGAGKSSVLEAFHGYLYAKENKDNLHRSFIVYNDKNNKLFYITEKKIKLKYQHIIQEKRKFLNLSYSIFFDFTIFHTISNEGGEVYKKFYSIEPSRTFQTGNQISKVESVSIHANLKMKSLYFYFLANENKNLLNKLNLPAIKKVKIKNKKLQRDAEKIISIIETGLKNENLKGDNYQNFLTEILDKLKIILDKKENHENEITKIKDSIKNYFKLSQNDKQYILDTDFSFFKNKEELILLEILNNIFPVELEFEYQEENFTYSELSTGQKIILSYIGIIANNILLYCDVREIKNIFIFLDEVETGFHPAFQKNLLFIFQNILNTIFKKYNFSLFFLTHSPFILSDLAKENIIFMKEGKNVSNEVDIETFGANIHTLLTHGFFMEDGLMGEYAKSKIDEVIKYLNNEESKIASEEEAQKIINIIGEPIIKKELQKKLDSIRLKNVMNIDEKIKLLEYELEILKKYQTKNTKDELNDRAKKKYYLKKKNEKNKNNPRN